MKITWVSIAAILCTRATFISGQGCNGMTGMRVYLIADNGQKVARCNGCAPAVYNHIQDIAALNGRGGDPFAIWTLEEVGGNLCALKGDNGNYLARCAGCWKGETFTDSVVVYPLNQYGQWLMERHGSSFSFKSDTGKFMSRCNGCIQGANVSNIAFVNSDSPTDVALWQVVPVHYTGGCYGMTGRKVYIIADNCDYLARCHQCASGNYPNIQDLAGVYGQAGAEISMWNVEEFGPDKCAFRGDNGNYLARCDGCWKGEAYTDSVVVYPLNQYGLWTLEKHGDYFAFKADTGKYMARCNQCITGGVIPNFAMVYHNNPTGYALWKIQNV